MTNKCVVCGDQIAILLKSKQVCYNCLSSQKKKLPNITNPEKNK